MQYNAKQVFTYLILVVFLSALPLTLMLHAGRLDIGFMPSALMWCPGFSALISCAIFKLKISEIGWNFYPIKYEWLAYFLPLLYTFPIYLCVWILIDGSFQYASFTKAQSLMYSLPNAPAFATWFVGIPLMMTMGVILNVSACLGEEIGWRGFLFPRLYRRFGFTGACFLTGIIWAMWHYIGIFYLGYSGMIPKFESAFFFTLMVIAWSFILGFIRIKSQSVWPCTILHASHNLFIQIIFNPLTTQVGKTNYIIGEFGFGLVVTTGILAIYFWRKRAELKGAN